MLAYHTPCTHLAPLSPSTSTVVANRPDFLKSMSPHHDNMTRQRKLAIFVRTVCRVMLGYVTLHWQNSETIRWTFLHR